MSQCELNTNVYDNMPCSSPKVDAFLLFGPAPVVGIGDATTAAAVIGQRANVVRGIKFEAVHSSDPSEWFSDGLCDPNPLELQFFLRIWEALVVLPLSQNSKTLPFYLPTLTTASQSFDVADRVLWKRLTIMPMWGLNASFPFGQLTATMRDTNAGPQVVKTSCRLDDRHGLFYVRAYTHNLVLTPNPNCGIQVRLNFWAKLFYQHR